MSTVRDLIKSALQDLGALAAGQTPTASEQADAFDSLKEMLAIHGHPEYDSKLVWHDRLTREGARKVRRG